MLIIFRKFYQTPCLIKLDCVYLHHIDYLTYKLAIPNDNKIKQKNPEPFAPVLGYIRGNKVLRTSY